MGSKLKPGKFDCYTNALPDEPMFILLARDSHAAAMVQEWAMQRKRDIEAGERPQSDFAMCQEAFQCAEAMREWRMKNLGKWTPDKAGPVEHTDVHEVGTQEDGWPGGDIVTYECSNCGHRWRVELPQ